MTSLLSCRSAAEGGGLVQDTAPQSPGSGHHLAKLRGEEKQEMAVMIAGGASVGVVGKAYGVTASHVRRAMANEFGSVESMKKALLGMSLQNAVACQSIVADKIDELTGSQAVFAGKVLVETALSVEKSIQDAPKTVDFAAIKRIGEGLARIREVAAAVIATSPVEERGRDVGAGGEAEHGLQGRERGIESSQGLGTRAEIAATIGQGRMIDGRGA